jgi:hypothetical protein
MSKPASTLSAATSGTPTPPAASGSSTCRRASGPERPLGVVHGLALADVPS